jgi:hypothetical protein
VRPARRRALACLLAASTVACAEGSTVPSGGGGSGTGGNGSNVGAGSEGGQGGEGTGASAQGGGPTGGGPQGGAGAGGDGPGGEGVGGEGAGPIEQSCPPDQFAVGFDGSGTIQCAPIGAEVPPAVNAACDVFVGIRDNCGSCSTAPAKWGRVSGAACANGTGVDNTCSTSTIGGQNVGLFGLNTDGDVDENDKLYMGFVCDAGVAGEGPGPCDPGEVVVGWDGATATCASAGAFAQDFVRGSCSIYLGWRDECDGCTSAPAKWGWAGSTGCNVGSGAGNTCVTTTLTPDDVPLLGIDLDGDFDGNDKLYFGVRCPAATPAAGPQSGTCPAGQVVVGTHADGTIECASPAPQISAYVAEHCWLYSGWRDECNGCTTIPAKYGRAREGACVNDAGVDSTCFAANLAGNAVSLYGLNTDGDVNDDDKLYVGFKCD